MRVVAVDWSGSVSARGRTTWVCAVVDGEPVFLEAGRTAAPLAELLTAWARADARFAVGLDFAFSFPAWYVRHLGHATARSLWEDAARNADDWLRACAPPFWGRPGRSRPADPGGPWMRACENEVPSVAGTRPKSVFQVGGAGAVGTGSLRGMALLASLSAAGFAIWPFDDPAWPVVVEIYPRALTGPVRKSDAAARRAYLDTRDWPRDVRMRDRAAATEDSFDAAVSAHVMWQHAGELAELPPARDAVERIEGRIWLPQAHA